MSASPKSKRENPPNKFEDYILTYTVGQNLYPIDSSAMSYISGYTGEPYTIGNAIVGLGFDFRFDNRAYRQIYVSTYGFAILLDPEADPDFVIDATMDDASDNSSVIMNSSPWSSAHVLLCPWWDTEVRSVFRNTSNSGVSTYLTGLGLTLNNVNLGISTTPPGIDASLGGVKSFSGFDPNEGKFLVIRWKIFTNPSSGTKFNIGSYDIVVYESGVIEFRYGPRIFHQYESDENATMAIFACGGSTYGKRYRDLSYVLRKDSRGKYRNGGSVYNGTYTDTDGSSTADYTISLNSYKDWPGLEKGATFRLTPPRNKRRTTRKVLNDRDSASFIRGGIFNDQKTINYNSQSVQFPAMIPVDYVTSMNDYDSVAIVELYTSGSIEITRTNRSGLIDDIFNDCIIERGKR
jgi:hypothetical protein